MFLLDTHLSLVIIQKAPPKVVDRLLACSEDEAGISVVTLGELAHAVARSDAPAKSSQALELLLAALQVVEFTAEAALAWAKLRAQLDAKGIALDTAEAMIAAHALSLGATLATSKPRELRRVAGLTVENWLR